MNRLLEAAAFGKYRCAIVELEEGQSLATTTAPLLVSNETTSAQHDAG